MYDLSIQQILVKRPPKCIHPVFSPTEGTHSPIQTPASEDFTPLKLQGRCMVYTTFFEFILTLSHANHMLQKWREKRERYVCNNTISHSSFQGLNQSILDTLDVYRGRAHWDRPPPPPPAPQLVHNPSHSRNCNCVHNSNIVWLELNKNFLLILTERREPGKQECCTSENKNKTVFIILLLI